MTVTKTKFDDLSSRIIGCALTVAGTLSSGFAEKVYENALALELRNAGLVVAQQHGVQVTYQGVTVGQYTTDLLVENTILIELKAVKALDPIHHAQCLNYLKATNIQICLVAEPRQTPPGDQTHRPDPRTPSRYSRLKTLRNRTHPLHHRQCLRRRAAINH
jgi:GxxExxY protein